MLRIPLFPRFEINARIFDITVFCGGPFTATYSSRPFGHLTQEQRLARSLFLQFLTSIEIDKIVNLFSIYYLFAHNFQDLNEYLLKQEAENVFICLLYAIRTNLVWSDDYNRIGFYVQHLYHYVFLRTILELKLYPSHQIF